MDTNHDHSTTANATRSDQPTPTWLRLIGLVTLTALLASAAPMAANSVETDPAPAAAGAGAAVPTASSGMPTLGRDDDTSPDETAGYIGGIAAQLRTHDGNDIPGDLFLLMASEGSTAKARLYDHTPYTLTTSDIHPEATESNQAAVDTVEEITGLDIETVDFTSAPGGGPSGGLTYTIAYLNIVSDGAFTGRLTVAATGALQDHGYVQIINSINEKTTAAYLAEADVLFTPSTPNTATIDTFATRIVGELFRARNTGATLTNERLWDNYHSWGTNRSDDGMDIVAVRHIGDVAAYLCGTGSDYACTIRDHLADTTTINTTTTTHDAPAPDQAIDSDTPTRVH